MSVSSSYASEAQFGPPSELISIQEFLQSSSQLQFINHVETDVPRVQKIQSNHWNRLSPERQQELATECSADDLRSSVENAIANPFNYSFIVKMHEDNLDVINASSKPGGHVKQKSRKRKRTDVLVPEDVRLPPEVQDLRDNLDRILLKSWPYSVEAANFVRPQKISDLNNLTKVRPSKSPEHSASRQSLEAVITVSVYNRLSWGSTLNRSSQHAVLSSNTIGELYDAIPCSSNEIPAECPGTDGEAVGYRLDGTPPQRGSVVCIEGTAYGDGLSETDYAAKLNEQMEKLPQRKRRLIQQGPIMHDVRFVDLTLRINQPYWLLHQGSCEHFLVIDQIRLRDPSDTSAGFPLALHITPPIVDLCQACARVPSSVVIVGDIRLGQSPCKLCGPCWRSMGEPKDKESILVVPMARHEFGW